MNINETPRFFCLGFRKWKATNLKPLISLHPERVFFLNKLSTLEKLNPLPTDIFIVWGYSANSEYESYAKDIGARFLRIEDGFIRSVGLGSDLIRPSSIIFDEKGIYFDPSRPSDLEDMLNHQSFSEHDLKRAQLIRRKIIHSRVTKYNIETHRPLKVDAKSKKIIFVPGQVEDDASVILGAGLVKTNIELLKTVRFLNSDAYIIYKPHPDVLSGNRKGRLTKSDMLDYADKIEVQESVISCIDASDEIHTITSLAGFDALLRKKKVVTYGQPFYAGWGLTKDLFVEGEAFKRRNKKLKLDELIAGALIHYPIYWDWDLKGYTTCEATIHHLVEQRNLLEANGKLEKLRVGFVRRQIRKLDILLSSFLAREI